MGRRAEIRVSRVATEVYVIPTDAPESDGTICWDHTTMVIALVEAGDQSGMGYTYCHPSAAALCEGVLAEILVGRDVLSIEASWAAMNAAVRNIGRPGIAACAISAIDVALWDLKAKCLNIPLALLLGQARDIAAVYGSGGFTSYDQARLEDQLAGWSAQGCRWVKMKVGRDPDRDRARVEGAARAAGDATLLVDANGAYDCKQALAFAARFADAGVTWFEEPVSSDNLAGLALLRSNAPAGMEIAAGEYGYMPCYFHSMLASGAVDVLQADATRCGGFTGFLRAAAIADGFQIPLSSHCAPALHLPAALAAPRFRHMEWFHDHVRIEQMLLEGAPRLENGCLAPDLSAPGHGLSLRRADAERFAA
jgi:L-alanine-DL-glutamate epimerase-like enolase superfamily enzyme